MISKKATDTVILVGNSKGVMQRPSRHSILASTKPEVVSVINDHDIIVRMNGGYGSAGHDLTSRFGRAADYWSFSTHEYARYKQWKNLHPHAAELRLNNRLEYAAMGGYNGDLKTYKSLIADYGHLRPSTGLLTIHYITHYCNSKLSIIGFDFFKTNNWYTQARGASVHDWQREKEYVSSMSKVTIL